MTAQQQPDTATQLVEATEAISEAQAKRERLIRRRHEQGASLRDIAAEAGLSHTQVANILSRT